MQIRVSEIQIDRNYKSNILNDEDDNDDECCLQL